MKGEPGSRLVTAAPECTAAVINADGSGLPAAPVDRRSAESCSKPTSLSEDRGMAPPPLSRSMSMPCAEPTTVETLTPWRSMARDKAMGSREDRPPPTATRRHRRPVLRDPQASSVVVVGIYAAWGPDHLPPSLNRRHAAIDRHDNPSTVIGAALLSSHRFDRLRPPSEDHVTRRNGGNSLSCPNGGRRDPGLGPTEERR